MADVTATGEGGTSALFACALLATAKRPAEAGVGGGAAEPRPGGVAYALREGSVAEDAEAGVRGGVSGVWDGRSGVHAVGFWEDCEGAGELKRSRDAHVCECW